MAKTNAMGLTDITALTSRIQELEKDNYMDIDCDVVNYCLELLNNTENTMCAE